MEAPKTFKGMRIKYREKESKAKILTRALNQHNYAIDILFEQICYSCLVQ